MADDCCKLSGNLNINGIFAGKCVTSVSMNAKPEIIGQCGGEVLFGPTIGTVSVTGYATDLQHQGCPGRAGVSIPWIRKYDCENNILHFIPNGEGASYIAGDVENLARLRIALGRSYPSISASSQSGPATVYMETFQEDGYGLIFSGDPLSIDTSQQLVFTNFGIGDGDMYLQNFSVEFSPGELPIASYSFAFSIVD
jgi:hypothetical protein